MAVTPWGSPRETFIFRAYVSPIFSGGVKKNLHIVGFLGGIHHFQMPLLVFPQMACRYHNVG